MLFLKEFWKGEISPGETRYHTKEQYSKPFRTMERCERVIKGELSEVGLAAFEEFAQANIDASCVSDCDNFIEGFRMGAKVILDILLKDIQKSA